MRRIIVGLIAIVLSASCTDAPTEASARRQLLLRNRLTLDLFVINDDASGLNKIVDGTALQVERAIWSPDGSKILVLGSVASQSDLYVMNADGSGRVRITNDASPETSPSWDGRTIVFIRAVAAGTSRGSHVLAVNADGSGLRDLTPGTTLASEPDISPDGRVVAFIARDAANTAPRLETVDLAGGTRRTLLTSPNELSLVASPRFSPDGNTIAFYQSIVTRGVLESGTWLVEASTARARLLIAGLGFTEAANPWSADGKTLLLGSESIYLVDFMTGSRTLVVSSILAGSAFGRSPDGAAVVFTRVVGAVGPSAWTATISGTNVRRLSEDWFADPVWRPGTTR